ncbi:hypothetical protein JTB14_019281 [Gonioctena quinquepunctata]|nr:hypothetical protein JTB14_019281 [Gonioctena quinquepunctata]
MTLVNTKILLSLFLVKYFPSSFKSPSNPGNSPTSGNSALPASPAAGNCLAGGAPLKVTDQRSLAYIPPAARNLPLLSRASREGDAEVRPDGRTVWRLYTRPSTTRHPILVQCWRR